MFAYCNNNPVLLSDQEGNSATIAGAICGGLFGAVNAMLSGGTAKEVLECAVIGAVTGAVAGLVADISVATCGVGGAIIISAIGGGLMSAANSAGSQAILNDGDINTTKVVYDGLIGATMGGMCTAVGNIGTPVSQGLKEGYNAVAATVTTEMTMLSSGKLTGQFLFDLGATAVTAFGSWMFGAAGDYYNKQL